MLATRMFNSSALGLITAGDSDASDITAMYPDAPAWPTEEYRKATSMIAATSSRCSEDIVQL